MTPPRGITKIREFYGDPRAHVLEDGGVSAAWASQMVTVPMPHPLPLGWDRSAYATRVRVHYAIAGEVDAVFAQLQEDQLWSRLRTYDGGYTWRRQRGGSRLWRRQRGGSRLSMHALGGALDFDAPWNGLGEEPQMDRDIVRVFERRGWTWGGRWRRPDGMHFQWAKGY